MLSAHVVAQGNPAPMAGSTDGTVMSGARVARVGVRPSCSRDYICLHGGSRGRRCRGGGGICCHDRRGRFDCGLPGDVGSLLSGHCSCSQRNCTIVCCTGLGSGRRGELQRCSGGGNPGTLVGGLERSRRCSRWGCPRQRRCWRGSRRGSLRGSRSKQLDSHGDGHSCCSGCLRAESRHRSLGCCPAIRLRRLAPCAAAPLPAAGRTLGGVWPLCTLKRGGRRRCSWQSQNRRRCRRRRACRAPCLPITHWARPLSHAAWREPPDRGDCHHRDPTADRTTSEVLIELGAEPLRVEVIRGRRRALEVLDQRVGEQLLSKVSDCLPVRPIGFRGSVDAQHEAPIEIRPPRGLAEDYVRALVTFPEWRGRAIRVQEGAAVRPALKHLCRSVGAEAVNDTRAAGALKLGC